jgi:ubiquinone/menaquinone biosynthesis C-methylase UbiE
VLHRVVHYEFRTRRAMNQIQRVGRHPTRGNARAARLLLSVPANFVRWRWTRRKLGLLERQPSISVKRDNFFSVSSVAETARAFDAVANEYDGALGNNALIQHMRERVLARIAATFPRGSRLLDLGCGTGIDAVNLAARGYEIVAMDSSRAMVERTCARIRDANLEHRARAIHLGIHELDRLHDEPFDGIYSNFGALNCVPDLRAASPELARLLKPRGRIVASVIGKYAPWELAFHILRFNFKRAFVRLTNRPVPVPLRGETIWTRYYSPRDFYRTLYEHFQLVALRALNLFLPPPYLVHIYERNRNIFAPLAWLEDNLASAPILQKFGDHFLIELRKRD